MERVIFCVFSAKDEEVYNKIVPHFFPPTEEDLAAEKEQETEDESDSGLTKESEQHTVWCTTLGMFKDGWSTGALLHIFTQQGIFWEIISFGETIPRR